MENSARPKNGQARSLPSFDAIPKRAKRDRRLHGSHWAVLAAVQDHDRFSRYNGGAACWASVRTMARETHLQRTTVADAVNDLLAWGYLSAERRGKYRHLRVIFEPAMDELIVRPQTDSIVRPQTSQRKATKEIAQKRSAGAEKAIAADLKRCLQSANLDEASHGARARQGALRSRP